MINTNNSNSTSPKVLVNLLTKDLGVLTNDLKLMVKNKASKLLLDMVQGQIDKLKASISNASASIFVDSAIDKLTKALPSDLIANHIKLIDSDSFNKDSIQYVVTITKDGVSVRYASKTTRKASTSKKGKVSIDGVTYSSFHKAVIGLITNGIVIKGAFDKVLDKTYEGKGVNDRLTLDKNKIEYVEIFDETLKCSVKTTTSK